MTDKDLLRNFMLRFVNILRKKEGLFANFKVKGVRNGSVVTASISVDLDSAGVDPTDSLETIIQQCSHRAVEEIKKADFTFEGVP